MSASMRILHGGPTSARGHVAFAAAMAELHRVGQIPDTVRFYSYPRALLLGCEPRRTDAAHQRTCKREGIELARRPFDGEAIFVGPGVLGFDMVAARHSFCRRLHEALERIGQGLAAGLGRFGLPVRIRASQDIEVGGRTLATAEGSIDGATVMVQGQVLVDVDRDEVAAVLRMPNRSRARARRPELAARITSLSEWLGRAPAMDEVCALLIAGMSHAWSRQLEPGVATPLELNLARRLLSVPDGLNDMQVPAFVAGAAARAASARHRRQDALT